MATSRARSIGEASVRGRDEAARSAQSLAIVAETFFVCAPRTCPTTPTTPTTALAHVPNQAFPSSHRRHSPTSRSDTPTSRSRHVLPFSQAVQAVPSNFPSKAPGNTTHQPQDFPTSPLANRPCPTRAPVPHYQGPAQTEPSTSPSRARGNAERQHQLRPFPLSRARSRCLSYARVACTSNSRRHSHTQRSRDAIPLRALSVGYAQFAPLHLHP